MINLTGIGNTTTAIPEKSLEFVNCVNCAIQRQMLQAQFSFLNTVKLACIFAGVGILLIGISIFFKKVMENMGNKRVEKIIQKRKEEQKDD